MSRSGIASAPGQCQRLRRPPLRSGPTGDTGRPLRLRWLLWPERQAFRLVQPESDLSRQQTASQPPGSATPECVRRVGVPHTPPGTRLHTLQSPFSPYVRCLFATQVCNARKPRQKPERPPLNRGFSCTSPRPCTHGRGALPGGSLRANCPCGKAGPSAPSARSALPVAGVDWSSLRNTRGGSL